MRIPAVILSASLLVAYPVQAKTMEVVATSYCACKICTGKSPGDKGYGITASGLPVRPGMIAVDKKVIRLGMQVRIDGKEYLAADTGSAIRGARIDIFMSSHQAALEFGRKRILIEF